MPSVSKKQQRFFGIIRAIKKGVFKGKKTPEIQRAASSISDKDSKKMASTKHKGLPEKVKEELNTDDKPFVKKLVGKLRKGSKTHAKQADDLEKAMNEDYVKELEDGLVKMDYPSYDEVDKLMCKIAKENDIDTTTLHMAFKTKHLMVPDDWAKKKMMEPVIIPKTPKITGDVDEAVNAAQQAAIAISKRKRLEDLKVAKKKKLRKLRKEEYISELSGKTLNRYKDKVAAQIEKRLDGLNMANRKLEAKKVEKLPPPMKKERLGIVKNETGKTGGNVIDAKDRFKKEDYAPVISEKCWKGYEKKGMKTMFGKRYPNCVKKKRTNESVETINELSQDTMASAAKQAMQKRDAARGTPEYGRRQKQVLKFVSGAVKKRQQRDRAENSFKKPDAERPPTMEEFGDKFKIKGGEASKQMTSDALKSKRKNKRDENIRNLANNPGTEGEGNAALAKKKPQSELPFGTKLNNSYSPEGQSLYEYDGNYHMNKIAKEKGLDLTDPRQRRRANSLARKNAAKGNVNNPAGFSKRKKRKKMQTEGNLHKWFKGSKSKDGKGGWVNVVTGGTCASDKPGEGTPKCVSSSKRASMTKAERLSAQRRKKKADPNQQSKTGAAKPTYVKTDSPRKKKKVSEEYISELSPSTLGSYIKKASFNSVGNVQAAYSHPKKRKNVSGPDLKDPAVKSDVDKVNKRLTGINKATDKLVKKAGKPPEKRNTIRGASPDSTQYISQEEYVSEAGARIGKKYKRDEYGDPIKPDGSSALKKNVDKNPKDDKTPNTLMGEAKSPAWQRKAGKSESGGLNAKGVASYRAANPGSKLKTAVTTKPSKLKKGSKSSKRRLSFCRRMKGMKKKLTSAKTARDPDSRINKSLRKWNCSFEPETGEMIMERGPQVLGSGARQKSIHAKKGKKGTKKVSGMIISLKRKGSILKQPLGGPADAAAKARRLSYVKDDTDLTILRFIDEGHMNKTCGKGEYYCYNDKKCKPIPKGMKIGYGGMLKPIENEKDESNGKKGGSNGNGNGHGGNGNGNGGNGNGGNGGGNGGGE